MMIFALFIILLAKISNAADPDMLQDVCVADMSQKIKINGFPCKANADANDFKSSELNKPGDTSGVLGFSAKAANVLNFAGLNTLGVSFTRLDFKEGGLNPPHIHPRGTELLFVHMGTLYVGFIDTNNTLFAQTLYPGDLFVFPRGLIHFQLNIGKGPALGLSGFNSQNPGTSQVAKAVFASQPPIDDRVIEIAFQLHPEVIPEIREAIAKT